MERRLQGGLTAEAFSSAEERRDPNDLLHPAQAFEHPSHVVNDPDLTLNEKRAILASWASDACAPEAAPYLRCAPGGKQPILFDDVMDALRTWTSKRTKRTARGIGARCAAAAWKIADLPLPAGEVRSTERSDRWKLWRQNMWWVRYDVSTQIEARGS